MKKRTKKTAEERRAEQERYDETTRLLEERIQRDMERIRAQRERREAS